MRAKNPYIVKSPWGISLIVDPHFIELNMRGDAQPFVGRHGSPQSFQRI